MQGERDYQEALKFLAACLCKAEGVEITPANLRKWIARSFDHARKQRARESESEG